MKSAIAAALCLFVPSASGFAFVQSSSRSCLANNYNNDNNIQQQRPSSSIRSKKSTTLSMVDTQLLMGGGIAVAGLAAGIGMVAFAEKMGERSELSEDMATRITGGLMEDVEVDSVSDLSSLTDKLEAALKETGGADENELQMTEEDKKRIAEEADDG